MYIHLGCLWLNPNRKRRFDQQFNFHEYFPALIYSDECSKFPTCTFSLLSVIKFFSAYLSNILFSKYILGRNFLHLLYFKNSFIPNSIWHQDISWNFQCADGNLFPLLNIYKITICKIHFCYGFGNKILDCRADNCKQWIIM